MKGCFFKLGISKYKIMSDVLVVRGENEIDDVMLMVKDLSSNEINCIPYTDIPNIWEDELLFKVAHN